MSNSNEPPIASLISELEPELVEVLEERAARSGRSVEHEVVEILRAELRRRCSSENFKQHLLNFPQGGRDEYFERPPVYPKKSIF